MKKILIGIIIIIPILVILSLNFVGNIVSTKAYVAVEKLTLTESEHVLSGVEDVFRLEAEILPKYATDKSVKFYIQQNSAGEEDVVLLDERFGRREGGGSFGRRRRQSEHLLQLYRRV